MKNVNNQQSNNDYNKILASEAKKICVIAGPGSGKTTKILIPKAKQLIETNKINPQKILLLSFSRLSAIDLQRKIKNSNLRKFPRASTVHSFCLSFLLSEDNYESRKRVNSIVLDFEKEILISDLKNTFPSKNKRELRKKLNEFSAGWATKSHDTVFEENQEDKKFKNAVINWLSEYESAMMEEIIYFAVDLAEKLPSSQMIEEVDYILVDEYQDLNMLEQKFINILARDSKILLVVGDPDQSIYSFKFAYPSGILDFANRSDVNKHSLPFSWRCPKKIINVANQLLLQDEPPRTNLINPLPNEEEGEVNFKSFKNQGKEFNFILSSIINRLKKDVAPENIIILVPRKKLGKEFVKFANEKENGKISDSVNFAFIQKMGFSDIEKEKILLFSLLVNPKSPLHIRSYLGLGDKENYFYKEIPILKQKYGSVQEIIKSASPDDFPKNNKRLKRICERALNLKVFLDKNKDKNGAKEIIDLLFPLSNEGLSNLKEIITNLMENDDTKNQLYTKFVDYIRTIPYSKNTIRIMTLMGAKGLDANHVYILGCNAGNIPGENHSAYLTDYEYKKEQRRLLYVGFTRAKKSLTVTWSQWIPFQQAKGHYTDTIKTRRINNKVRSKVGICPFLQNLSEIHWELIK